jgi:hypothetical protein
VTAPDGTGYWVRVSRNLPLRATPLGPFDNVVPQHVSLPVLLAANVYARGRTGWCVQVLQAETAWRAQRVIFTEKVRGGSDVADVAIALASAVHRGEEPWEEQRTWRNFGAKIKRVMNWD